MLVGKLEAVRPRARKGSLLSDARLYLFFIVLSLISVVAPVRTQAAVTACTPTAGFTVCFRITYSGADQTLTIPTGITSIQTRVWGAAGGGANSTYYTGQGGGAGGGYSIGTVAVTPGQTLTIVTGQGGIPNSLATTYGGGGQGGNSTASTTRRGGSGGGMSAVFSAAAKTAANALVIAGGGGGASPGADLGTVGAGGGGATTGGQDGDAVRSGRGGTQAAGGAAATGNSSCPLAPTAGAQFQGGNGANANAAQNEGGGGGGGGYFGGGGGICQSASQQNGGGGGGSAYIGGTGVTAASTTAGANFFYSGSACAGTAASGGASDSLYTAGIGVGSCYGTGGNGEVVIQYALPTVTLTKVSNGGVGGFTFTGNNGWSSQTITTITSGVGVAGATQILTGASTATTITESAPPAGFALTAVSCSGLGAGGTATVNLSTRSVLLNAAATAPGSAIACTFTNTRALVRVQKTTLGGFGGPFAFARTNLAAITNITTTAEATATPASPSALNVTTVGTAVTITETPIAGYALTAASCTDANSAVTGNVGAIGSFSGNVLTIPAGNVVAGSDLTCVFTNTRPRVRVQKITMGGFGGPFSFAQTNLASAPAAITTVTAGTPTPASPTAINVTTVGTAVTLTETVAVGLCTHRSKLHRRQQRGDGQNWRAGYAGRKCAHTSGSRCCGRLRLYLHLHQYQASHHHADQDQQWRGWWLHLQWRQWLWRGPDDHHGDQWCGGCRSHPHPGCGGNHYHDHRNHSGGLCAGVGDLHGHGRRRHGDPEPRNRSAGPQCGGDSGGLGHCLHLHQYQASHHHADQDQQWRGWWLHLQWRQWLWRGPDDNNDYRPVLALPAQPAPWLRRRPLPRSPKPFRRAMCWRRRPARAWAAAARRPRTSQPEPWSSMRQPPRRARPLPAPSPIPGFPPSR